MRPLVRLIPLLLGVALLSCATVIAADAQRRGAPHPPSPPRPPAHVVVRGEVFIGGYFYDPMWGPYPWWARPMYPRYYFPVYDQRAEVRLLVKPREAAVYVDGFYAGVVDEFDGVFQRLPVSPGSHEFVLYLAGHQTAHFPLYLGPGTSFDLHHQMLVLPPGVASEPPPFAPPVPPPPPGSYRQPRGVPPVAVPQAPPPAAVRAAGFGTLDLRVQPQTAQLTVDGQPWLSSEQGHFVVQVPAGAHHIDVSKEGYRRFAIDLAVRDGETAPLNVSLMQGTP